MTGRTTAEVLDESLATVCRGLRLKQSFARDVGRAIRAASTDAGEGAETIADSFLELALLLEGDVELIEQVRRTMSELLALGEK